MTFFKCFFLLRKKKILYFYSLLFNMDILVLLLLSTNDFDLLYPEYGHACILIIVQFLGAFFLFVGFFFK